MQIASQSKGFSRRSEISWCGDQTFASVAVIASEMRNAVSHPTTIASLD